MRRVLRPISGGYFVWFVGGSAYSPMKFRSEAAARAWLDSVDRQQHAKDVARYGSKNKGNNTMRWRW